MKGNPLISHFLSLTYFLSLGKGEEPLRAAAHSSEGNVLHGGGSAGACGGGCTPIAVMAAVLGRTRQSRGTWHQVVIDTQE